MTDISIVFPTANRLHHLKRCVESVRAHLGELSYEFVIVDGGSNDGSAEYLAEQDDVNLIQHGGLLGANKAFRDGLLAATGDYVCQLSDDIEVVDDCIPAAVDALREDDTIGQVAFFFQNPNGDPRMAYMTTKNGRVIFTAFGVTPRKIGELVDWWSPEYYQQYGDPDFTCKILEAGYQIYPLPGYYLIHHLAERDGALRQHYRRDVGIFYAKWIDNNGQS